uniref:Cullin family profile domain-containing protein n=1 Tax=Eutreptiella gymnastica TaxID=73025 RepID=A0A7S1N1C3_9EUGL|mmetsp:Transcript_104762/g.180653  ORF Transcript_104762/g.180653 Transcript_104762/m.180653 type:complete len:766 (+) Transcript_104762:253-2550(+)
MNKAGQGKYKQQTQGKPSPEFEAGWNQLEVAFQRLIDYVENNFDVSKAAKDGAAPGSNEWNTWQMQAYTCVYNLCTKNEGSKHGGVASQQILYQRAQAMIEKYLSERVNKQVQDKKGEELLRNVYTAWDHHLLVVRWGKFMFRYLDEYYTKNQNICNLRIMMLKCFCTAVYEKIKTDLRQVLLAEVQKERDGIEINRTYMKLVIQLFVDMGMDTNEIYENDFEKYFLQDTAKFYKRAASLWLNEDGGNFTYLRRVEKALNEEHNRAISYLHGSSLQNVINCVETELLMNYQMQVLEDPDAGTEALLMNNKTEDLGRMFTLFKRIQKGLEPMSAILRDFIKKEGKEINKKFCDGDIDGNAYIDASLDLYDKYTEMFQTYFENFPIFHKARKEAYEVFINETLQPAKGETTGSKVTTSELLSTYCDNLMKNEKVDPDELESKLHKIVCLFTNISDKDLFQEFYRKQMSKRLLVSKTDNDNERQLIAKLKMKMGAPYTSKLEGMIVDKGLSAETQKNFLDYCRAQDIELKLEFSAQVLTTGFWPAFKIDTLNPPEILSTHMDLFRQFYDHKTQSRVLKWVHSLGTATISSKFKKGQKEMIVSTYQACVLLLFNTKSAMTAGEMGKELALPLDEVKRTVHSLAFGKFAILKRTNDIKKKQITEDDEFEVNDDFNHPTRKFKIPNVIKTVGDPVEKTDENRRHVIEACIVRVMKSRKQLSHLDLQTECIRQLSNYFKPDMKVIKKRIEDLIQRGYLERDEVDRNIYRYLA